MGEMRLSMTKSEILLLVLVVVLGVALRASWMLNPNTGFMVDEVYYIPAALHYLKPYIGGIAPSSMLTENRYVPYYINPEHPPLAKLMIAAAIGIFGNNPIGWRFFSTLMGSLGTPAIYFAARRLFPKAALVTAAFYALYPMDISMSQIGMLDVFATTFSAISFAALVNDKPKLSGAFFGLATASKLTGLTVGLPILYYVLAKKRGQPLQALKMLIVIFAIAVICYIPTFIPMGVDYGWETVILDQFYMVLVQQHYAAGPGPFLPFEWLAAFSSNFNPTIFLNNAALTIVSVMGLIYCAIKSKLLGPLLLTGYFLSAFGLIVAAASLRVVYFFYLEDAAPVFVLLAGAFIGGLLDIGSKRARIGAFACAFAIFLVAAILVPIVLYGSSVPYAGTITRITP